MVRRFSIGKTRGKVYMGNVVLDITMSLDGYVAGPRASAQLPLGEGGLRLHDWIFGASGDADKEVIGETVASSGAVIVGGKTYHDAINDAWEGVTPFQVPAFVVTSRVPEIPKSGFSYVTEGIVNAINQAKDTAGHRNVWVMGGANIAQQALNADLVDELNIHIAPVLLGEGVRLFEHIGSDSIELTSSSVIGTSAAVHLRYRIVK
jgi:dihydrofolate reductase